MVCRRADSVHVHRRTDLVTHPSVDTATPGQSTEVTSSWTPVPGLVQQAPRCPRRRVADSVTVVFWDELSGCIHAGNTRGQIAVWQCFPWKSPHSRPMQLATVTVCEDNKVGLCSVIPSLSSTLCIPLYGCQHQRSNTHHSTQAIAAPSYW